MIVINIGGGPGSGKTTLAYYLTYRLKVAGYRAEFVGEAAREDHIYRHAPGVVPPALQDNQALLAGQQYERVKRLERHGVQVAVTDSPIIQGLLYEVNPNKQRALEPLLRLLQNEFLSINIFANRMSGTFDAESRVQKTEEEAMAFDDKTYSLLHWDLETEWGMESSLADFLLKRLRQLGKLPSGQAPAEEKQSDHVPERRSFVYDSDSE